MLRVAPVLGLLLLIAAAGQVFAELPTVRVGSKSFTESYLLAEIAAQLIESAGEVRVERKLGLGGTGIVYAALESGHIDVYPEYTGTISRAILKDPSVESIDAIRGHLASRTLTVSDSLGFSNTYALAMRKEQATRLGVRTISDLARHRGLVGAFDSGFLERDDGWPGLQKRYGLQLREARAIEHALAYAALDSGRVDVIDVFSTDGQLDRSALVVLEDDRRFFPDYSATLLARQDFATRFPRTWARLRAGLVGKLDSRTMSRLNAQADVDRRSFADVARGFLGASSGAAPRPTVLSEIARLTIDHLVLVVTALAVGIAVGIPLAIVAARRRRLGQVELLTVGVLQTVPALALLCFMIPLLGIGKLPALVALSLYALLPIVRNTYTGLVGLDRQLMEVADVLGLPPWQRLTLIELPLASLSIMAGIKTAAVTTVGTATLAAFIGGGGYGTLIVRGLALNDPSTILAGAVPSALMALAIHGGFELLDLLVVPRGLRLTLVRRTA
jgi:osmoprotectant transport system permease protein